jgi:hypothetical protein
MHGLINRSIQWFIVKTYGHPLWEQVAHRARIGPEGFEPMLHYDDNVTHALVTSAARVLDRPQEVFLEDLGAFLASIEPLRRLLRFGGAGFADFLMSLDEVQSRGQMALPDLELPELILDTQRDGLFAFRVKAPVSGWGAVVCGLVRAMADDYGALALIEVEGMRGTQVNGQACTEYVSVELLDESFVEGRSFELAQPGAA